MGAEEPEKNDAGQKGEGEKKGTSPFAKKMMKMMTVMAYISGVSGAGFLLSLYYIIFWDPNIQGVRPPGYLKTGEMVGLPQARVASMPQALVADPPSDHRRMSREYMEAYFRNLTADTGETRMAAENNLLEPKPTPYALPVIPETNHHHSSHQPHHNGQATLSNNNHQSSGPSPQQGKHREASPTDGSSSFYDDFRQQQQQQQQQQQHGQPPLSTSA
ncbi:uncharacterized protein [Macrobrachium rosenbergii]|uniref:uncharacterized protein isoform X1 n=1 Tax=Macrobrachium rosenbergii TaxID=79674 RepID=UPI0034D530F5